MEGVIGLIIIIAIFYVIVKRNLIGYIISLAGIVLPFLVIFSKELGMPNVLENNKDALYVSASILIIGGFIVVKLGRLINKFDEYALKGTVTLHDLSNTKKTVPINNTIKIIGIIIAGFVVISLLRTLMYSSYYSTSFIPIIFIIILLILIIFLMLIINKIKSNKDKNIFSYIIEEIKNIL